MNKETFNELADKLAMNLKSEEDVSEMARMLSKAAGVSRAKNRLVLTYADYRERPEGYTQRWYSHRTPLSEYLNYAFP